MAVLNRKPSGVEIRVSEPSATLITIPTKFLPEPMKTILSYGKGVESSYVTWNSSEKLTPKSL
jgi:hypothetical protein